ncbi:hypothetical protein HD554DRAFT_1286347 [Boletus coccyginus]|nr:hypothetical protein HD554DRAFT_1286347 [Boletus coccyginus]
MSRAAQDPQRLLTRSMTSNARRRSARLSGNGEKGRSPLHSYERPGTKKRKRLSVLIEGESRSSKSRRECGQIERAVQQVGPCESAVSRGSSARGLTTKTTARNHGSSRVKELEEQLDVALLAKQELAAEVREHKISSAQSTLKHLEEYFTCPMCFEIMACPYALIPSNCGHTFCATCILKWFFSRLHKECGSWHEAVDCPLCRSALPHTPERSPRSISCFPFTPNRTADIAIRGLMNAITLGLTSASNLAPILSDWTEDGHSKQEWSKRERAGRIEMTSIAAQWNTLKPTDFANIKNRLEV